MSTTRDHGKIVFECDECGDTFESGTSDFEEALHKAKHDQDWLVTKEGQTWLHICPSCID